jgi:hypothetical protein
LRAQVNDSGWTVLSPWLDGGLRQHFINPHHGLRRHSASLHWPRYAATSDCRALRSAPLGPAWGMDLCPASSLDRVINTEHINQLSHFHAQKLSVLNFVRFDQALHFLVKTLFVTHKFEYPVHLGASCMKSFLSAYDYTCTASFFVRVLRHNMHHIDLSVSQAGLPYSCAYPYVPDCSARE